MKLSSNVFGDSNDENNFPHNLLLKNGHVSKLRKAFANGSWANITLSKVQLIKKEKGFLGRRLGPLPTTGLSLVESVLKPIVKTFWYH